MTSSQELSLVTVLSQLNPVRNHKSCFLKIYINTIHQKKIQLKFVKLRLYLPCSMEAIWESFSRDMAVTYSPQIWTAWHESTGVLRMVKYPAKMQNSS